MDCGTNPSQDLSPALGTREVGCREYKAKGPVPAQGQAAQGRPAKGPVPAQGQGSGPGPGILAKGPVPALMDGESA